MRDYPLLLDPVSGTEALGILARAGLTPPVPVLAVAATSDWGNEPPTMHLDPTCPSRSSKAMTLTTLGPEDLVTLDDCDQPTPCHCRPSGALADWLLPRQELATALWALEVAEEELHIYPWLDLDEPEETSRLVYQWGSSALAQLGGLSAVHYGLTHPVGSHDWADDPGVVAATAEALEALSDAIATRAAYLGAGHGQADLHRWVVQFDTLSLGGTAFSTSQAGPMRAIACGGLLGTRPQGPYTTTALVAPASELRHHPRAVDLGPADVTDSADVVFGLYASYEAVRDQLTGNGLSREKAQAAALSSVVG